MVVSPSYGASPTVAAKVRAGNAAYAAGDYQAALEIYAQAEVDCPACAELAYNRGLAHYRLRDFDRARELFNEALDTRDLTLEAGVKFNLGNIAYAQALEKLADIPEAIEHARQAIYHYRDALDLDAEDDDARANIEIAQLLIKDLLDRQKKQQEQEQQQDQDQQCDNPQNEQESQEGDQQEEEPQEDQSQEQDQGGDEEQQPEEQQGEAEGDQAQQEQQSAGEQEQAAEPQEARELTREEAERLLQAVRDKEAQRREERARRTRVRQVPVTRDW